MQAPSIGLPRSSAPFFCEGCTRSQVQGMGFHGIAHEWREVHPLFEANLESGAFQLQPPQIHSGRPETRAGGILYAVTAHMSPASYTSHAPSSKPTPPPPPYLPRAFTAPRPVATELTRSASRLSHGASLTKAPMDGLLQALAQSRDSVLRATSTPP